MTENTLHVAVSGSVATVTLTRPAVHNALDETLVENLTQAFQKLGVAEAVRVVVLAAAGKSFCAGFDIGWMRRAAELSPAEALRDATPLVMLFDAIDRCPKPVVAVVNGPAHGGGVGLMAAADIAIAAEDASFSLPEVKLGMTPAPVAPYVAAAIGARACRRYMLTAERFDAREALRLGLVHAVVPADKLDHARALMVEQLLKAGPKAQAEVKEMLRVLDDSPAGPDLMRYAAGRFAELRASDEGREGLSAFLEKRKPAWSP